MDGSDKTCGCGRTLPQNLQSCLEILAEILLLKMLCLAA